MIRPGEYFLPLRLFSLCWVETTTLVQPTGLPSTYFTVTWLLASGCRSNNCPLRRFSDNTLQDLVGEVDRRRHVGALLVDLAFGAGEAEHHALVAGALFLAALLFLGVDAHGDVGRLAMQQDLDVGAVIGEAVLVVADVLDHAARDLGDQFAVDHRHAMDLAEQLAAAFARDHDLVRGAERLAAEPGIDQAVVGDAELDVPGEEGIEDRVGDLVRNLVRMALGNRL